MLCGLKSPLTENVNGDFVLLESWEGFITPNASLDSLLRIITWRRNRLQGSSKSMIIEAYRIALDISKLSF